MHDYLVLISQLEKHISKYVRPSYKLHILVEETRIILVSVVFPTLHLTIKIMSMLKKTKFSKLMPLIKKEVFKQHL